MYAENKNQTSSALLYILVSIREISSELESRLSHLIAAWIFFFPHIFFFDTVTARWR